MTQSIMRSTPVDVSARKSYELIDEPTGSDYLALLEGALSYCNTVVLTVSDSDVSNTGRAVLDNLAPYKVSDTSNQGRSESLYRYVFNRESMEILYGLAPSLYSWQAPELPTNLCLLRHDGTPWLISISEARISYIELSPFEKLLLARVAPGLASFIAYKGAKDAIIASWERQLESYTYQLQEAMLGSAIIAGDDGREGLVEALRDWINSDEQTRITVALELIAALKVKELFTEVMNLYQVVKEDEGSYPPIYERNQVLNRRWREHYLGQLENTLKAISPVT